MNDLALQSQEQLPQLPNHAFNQIFAARYGVHEAILIAHFQYWIIHNQRNGYNFKAGRTWTYQTRKEIASHFPYFSERQVRTITNQLILKGVLIQGNFNKLQKDQTLWYAFENEKMFTVAQMGKWDKNNEKDDVSHLATPIDQSVNSVDRSVKCIGTHTKQHILKESVVRNASNKEPPAKRPEPEKTDRSISYDCLKELPLPDEEKLQLSKFFTDEERLKDAVAFATADGFMPSNLAAVITSNYQNKRKPSKGTDGVISHNKAFCRDFMPLMRKALGRGANSRLEALNSHLEYTGVGGSNWPCWEWGLSDFVEKIKTYFTSRRIWNDDLEGLVIKYRT